MTRIKNMDAKELATEMAYLASTRPTSGSLRDLNAALDAYRNKSKRLDNVLITFDTVTDRYIDRVQRGYAGTAEWKQLQEAAKKIAPALDAIGSMQEQETIA